LNPKYAINNLLGAEITSKYPIVTVLNSPNRCYAKIFKQPDFLAIETLSPNMAQASTLNIVRAETSYYIIRVEPNTGTY
jgi:hypothetical protein